jgi:hypothetical protein
MPLVASGPIWTEYIGMFDPAYDLVRRSPRFTALVEQANLDLRRFDRPQVALQW